MTDNKYHLILASSSSYRAKLLSRLKIPFEQVSADIDETPLQNEAPLDLVKRLSIEKAQAIGRQYPDSWIIGSDQIAIYKDQIVGKPGDHQNAKRQLGHFSASQVEFITGLCLYRASNNSVLYQDSKVTVYFKVLSDEQIEKYLLADKPYDCAGSFKIESMGVSLFEKVVSEDPTSLEGLPLISLCKMLDEVGIAT